MAASSSSRLAAPASRALPDAAAAGASDGLRLALNVGAMLIAFVSLIALVNLLLGSAGGLFGFGDLSLQLILGYVFAPVAFAIGVPWREVRVTADTPAKAAPSEKSSTSESAPASSNA